MGEWLILMAAPSLGFWLMLRLYRLVAFGLPEWARRGQPHAKPDIERLRADLRRLDQEYRRTERSDQPHKAFRLRALSMAYDDVLYESCLAVDLPAPQRPLEPITRLETEAALAKAGVRW